MLAGAFSCHHLNARRSDEYIVPEALDGGVADTAHPGEGHQPRLGDQPADLRDLLTPAHEAGQLDR